MLGALGHLAPHAIFVDLERQRQQRIPLYQEARYHPYARTEKKGKKGKKRGVKTCILESDYDVRDQLMIAMPIHVAERRALSYTHEVVNTSTYAPLPENAIFRDFLARISERKITLECARLILTRHSPDAPPIDQVRLLVSMPGWPTIVDPPLELVVTNEDALTGIGGTLKAVFEGLRTVGCRLNELEVVVPCGSSHQMGDHDALPLSLGNVFGLCPEVKHLLLSGHAVRACESLQEEDVLPGLMTLELEYGVMEGEELEETMVLVELARPHVAWRRVKRDSLECKLAEQAATASGMKEDSSLDDEGYSSFVDPPASEHHFPYLPLHV